MVAPRIEHASKVSAYSSPHRGLAVEQPQSPSDAILGGRWHVQVEKNVVAELPKDHLGRMSATGFRATLKRPRGDST
eukprot:scaffold268324_cov31-Tisochrysis_lutea.AAC.3